MTNSTDAISDLRISHTFQAVPSTIKSRGFRYPGKAALILIAALCLTSALPAQETQQVEPIAAEPLAMQVQAPKTESSWMFTLFDYIVADIGAESGTVITNIVGIGFRNMPRKWGFETSFACTLPIKAEASFGFIIIKPSYSFLNIKMDGQKNSI